MSAAARPRLRELQRWFASVTTHPEGVLEAGAGQARAEKLSRLVTPGPKLSAVERLQIYRDGYFVRLIECLTDDYPALRHLLGEEPFGELAQRYIEAHPSRSPSLNAYGARLPAFCGSRSEPWAPFAADLARLEWALVEVVHASVSETMTPEALALVPPARWQTARLVASPGLRVLRFDYPVNACFQAYRDGGALELPRPAPSATAVYRRGLTLWRLDLEPRAAQLLEALVSGAPLVSAVAALESHYPGAEAGEELARLLPVWLGAWVEGGFFSGVV